MKDTAGKEAVEFSGLSYDGNVACKPVAVF